MRIVVAFGNPGTEYNFTRHNFGFLLLDFYAKLQKLTWQNKARFFALTAQDDTNGLLLVKPQTFYNDVGRSLRALVDFYKIKPQDLLIVCDDFYLPFGEIRYRAHGGAGGNNGLKSAIQNLKTEDFPRIRLGTGHPELQKRLGDVNFVLSHFTPEEHAKLPALLVDFADFVLKYA